MRPRGVPPSAEIASRIECE